MKRKRSRSGQFQMSFGVIFSIILIIAFIFVAYIAIRHFLDLKDCTLVANFYDSLQNEVDNVWKSQSADQAFSSALPSGIEYVCFADMTKAERNGPSGVYQALRRNLVVRHNTFFYPSRKSCGLASKEVLHLDLQNITKNENPYCIESDGKIEFRLEKGFYDALVRIK